MAIRNIVKDGDDILLKNCRPVTVFDDKLAQLLEDMAETMHEADGVGLAGPQVGIRRRVVTIDIGEGVMELVNPEFLETSGEQECVEGCLSFPGEYGITKRPKHVKVRAQDRHGKVFEFEADDFLANVCSHEFDHLDGIVFKTRAVRMLSPEELENMK